MNNSFQQELVRKTSRPVIANVYGGMALLDTGAEIPVCTLPTETLKDLFQAEMIVSHSPIVGFGGEDYGDVYLLKEFRFKDLIFPKLPVFVPQDSRNMQFRWIFSASMFDQLEYIINMKTHTLTVNVPDDETNVRRLRIYDKDGKLHILCGDSELI